MYLHLIQICLILGILMSRVQSLLWRSRFNSFYIHPWIMNILPRFDEDVFFHILSYLPRRDLYQWSQVSRKFGSIARPLLWCHIEFRYRYMTKSEVLTEAEDFLKERILSDITRSFWNGTWEQNRFLNLFANMYESPDIGAMVKEYVLLFKYTAPGVNPLTSNILQFFPNLRFLTIQTSYVSSQGPDRKPLLDPAMLGGILELSLDVASISFTEVASYMCLPKIHSLSIRGEIRRESYGGQGVHKRYTSKSSALRSLKFDWFMDDYWRRPLELHSNYTTLLQLPCSLETLSIDLRITCPATTELRSFWSTMKLHPGDISICLKPVKSSLKELAILALGGTDFDHDSTSLDLSTLACSAESLCPLFWVYGHQHLTTEWQNWISYFPCQLKSLK